jgi:hypothetical protein
MTLVIVILLLVGFKSIDAHSLNGAKNASVRVYLGLVPPEAPTHAFRATNLHCLDGQYMLRESTLPTGQKATGVLRSKPFTCPRWLVNTYQQAEVLYTTPVMVGLDDFDSRCLKTMPRLPTGWTGMEVNEWPARTASGGASELMKISYQFHRAVADKQLELNLTTDRPLDQSRVRLGPFSATTRTLRVTINGKRVNATLAPGGDSCWAWVDWPTGLAHLQIMAIAK